MKLYDPSGSKKTIAVAITYEEQKKMVLNKYTDQAKAMLNRE